MYLNKIRLQSIFQKFLSWQQTCYISIYMRNHAKKFIICAFIAIPLLLITPGFKITSLFAITYLGDTQLNSAKTIVNYSLPSQNTTKPERSHAPEPSTMFLLVSGLAGIIVRIAQRSFIKFKRVMDLILAILGLLIAAPILLVLAIAIKITSNGPIIYRQNRVGENGKVFRIFKLRTMYVNAEAATGAVWARKNDPRITPLGVLLRKTHLDELPQLFNVIIGEMSIVGPRPERPEIVRDLKVMIKDYEKRLTVKPGITGLAQVCHRYDETISDVRKKIKYDLLYIRKMCWLAEMRILAQTVTVALTGKGAR